MNTIKSGKIFCDKYNKEMGTYLSPKQIFTDVIVPIVYQVKDNGKESHMICWTNSMFAERKCVGKGKKAEDMSITIERFCNNVETDMYGLMTSLNVFGGCAKPDFKGPKKSKKKPTCSTENVYNDNIYFNINERYYSFIGSLFMIMVPANKSIKNVDLIINNEVIIWKLFEGIKEYRKFLNENDSFKDGQLNTWNALYLYKKFVNSDFSFPVSSKNGVFSFSSIPFENILFAISSKKFLQESSPIKYIEMINPGQTNISFGAITIDIPEVKRYYNMFNIICEEIEGKKFDYFNYSNWFGSSFINKVITSGAVYSDMFNPYNDTDFNNISNNNVYFEKFRELMITKEEKELADKIISVLIKIDTNERNSLKSLFEKLSSSLSKKNNLQLVIDSLTNFIKVIEDKDEISNIIDELVVLDLGKNEGIFYSYINSKLYSNKLI